MRSSKPKSASRQSSRKENDMIYSTIESAFMFVSSAPPCEHYSVVNRATGEAFFTSDYTGDSDYPDDVDGNDDYISIPHKNDLDLGKPLVMEFVRNRCPKMTSQVLAIFSRAGAYQRYKQFLAENSLLEEWYAFENARTKEAILKWCAENGLVLEPESPLETDLS
jgi:hypothetical protein